MSNSTLLAQLFATDPRKLVRFPELPVEAAMAELRVLQERVQAPAPAPAPVAPPAAPAAKTPPPGGGFPEGFAQSLCTLATHVWRTKGKLVDPATGEPKEETRRAYRHIEGAFETFAQMGLTMNDWINQPFDPGLPVKVLTFQPTSGITQDTVVEAVRPTVIWKDQLLQLGEVVVGIPANTENPTK